MMATINPTPWESARRPSLVPSGQTLPSIGNLAGLNGSSAADGSRDSGNWSLTSSQRASNSKFLSLFPNHVRRVSCAGIGSLSLRQYQKSHYPRSTPTRETALGTKATLYTRRHLPRPLLSVRRQRAFTAHTRHLPETIITNPTMESFRHRHRRRLAEAASIAGWETSSCRRQSTELQQRAKSASIVRC